MTDFAVHPQLLADCHVLGRLPATHLLLHKNAALPWFILVPETGRTNLLDLPEPERNAVLADCKRVSDHLTGVLDCARVNVAWIGNLVAQLHVHVIGRSPGDPCWPRPVWGHLEAGRAYEPAEVAALAAGLPGLDPAGPVGGAR
jgi:diadenosine tetraphosphate (Ap4A) HIT family hydrolase